MSDWEVTRFADVKLKNAFLIEGLPGIGNVGKIVVDYLIEKTKAKRIARFFSFDLPNSVFVNEKNLIELPKIEAYHVKVNDNDFIFLTGDVQPSDERASFEFCELILKECRRWGVKRIVTLGGIGLQDIPNNPKVYCTGNNESFRKVFLKAGASGDVYGVVGPIIGVSGVLLGLAGKRKIPAVALLAETFGHPMYLGLRGARSSLKVLAKALKLKVSLKDLDDEIAEEDKDEVKTNPKLKDISKLSKHKDINYIG